VCVCVRVCVSANTDPEVGGGESVGGGDAGGGGGVGVEGVDVGQQRAHHRGNAGTHVLGRQTRKVPENKTRAEGATTVKSLKPHTAAGFHSLTVWPRGSTRQRG